MCSNIVMIMQHKQISAEIIYSAATKSYYGELLDIDQSVCFQATSKHEALALMQKLVEEWLLSSVGI